METEKIVDVDTAVLNRLLETKDFATLDEQRITSKFFTGIHRQVFKFIVDHKINHKEVPSIDTIKSRFPAYREYLAIEIPPEPLTYYCGELREKLKNNMIMDFIEEAIKARDKDPYNTEGSVNLIVKDMRKTLITIEREIVRGDCRDISQDSERVIDRYFAMKNGDIPRGVETGIDAIDYLTRGLQPTDLWTFIGYTNVGKTMLLCIIAYNMSLAGLKPLFITREMNPDQIMGRITAIWNRFNMTMFNRQKLTPEQEKILKAFPMLVKEKYFLPIEQSTGGIINIASLIDKHAPDCCLVDGAYMMTEDSTEKEWNKYVDTWASLKQISMSQKCPIIATMQSKTAKTGLDTIAMAKYINMYVDSLWGMEDLMESEGQKALLFRSLKQREAEKYGKFVLNWDFSEMDWSMQRHEMPGLDEFLVGRNSRKFRNTPEQKEEKVKSGKIKFKRSG